MTIPRPSPLTTALVTGASTPIGAALAHQLAARAHHLTLVARRTEQLDELAARIRAEHRVGVEVMACDLADPDARARLLERIAFRGRQVAVLVNNAGGATGGDFVGIDTADEITQVRVLVEAVVDLTSRILPGMVERGGGAVLNVASTAGLQPLPWSAGYAAAKAHTIAFTEALHHELAGRGVSVTALCPGPVRSGDAGEAGEQATRGMPQAVSQAMSVPPETVAEIAIASLERNRRVVVPGAMVRLTALGSKLTPKTFQLPALRRAMQPSPAQPASDTAADRSTSSMNR
ncbi:SDR family NAD(P)-dependent oxidoreductase [Nocardioides stalactiti]|uniref:SDR family NAD(P)-dependent oxidoreductase n=1 Tax=Nocardioides stalactiti TaxID=2755356 RepID=UPI001601762C|nr:SDR family oxidoreductase [Nocardioides stalactiti]